MKRGLLTLGAWALVAIAPAGGAVALIAALRPPSPAAPAKPAPKAVAGPAVARAAPVPAPSPKPVPAADFVIRRVLAGGGPIAYGDYLWDDAGVPAGPLVVTIDLEAETLSVFRGGYEIGATAILYGEDSKPTPLGSFAISEKDVDHVSNLYHAPMPYMLRLTSDGVSIHASEVEWGYATHGCIGVPLAFAKKLFAIARLGDRVIITRGKRIGMGDTIIRS